MASPRPHSKAPKTKRNLTTQDDFIKCEICKQKLVDPRTLACLHSFCRECLLAYMSETSPQKTIPCPLCLQHTDVPHPQKAPETWVDDLPCNPFLFDYLEALSLRDPGKECDTCRRQHKARDAEKWCRVCHDALCRECVGFHNSLKTTTQHKLVDISTIRREPIEDNIETPLCPTHGAESLSKYCETHRCVVCEKCIANAHKDCRTIRPVRDAMKSQTRDATDTRNLLAEETKLGKSICDNRTGESHRMEEQQTDLLQEIQSVRQKVNDQLKKCETQLIGELYELHGKESATVQSEMKEAQRVRKSASKVHGLVDKGMKCGTESHQLQLIPGSEDAAEHYRGKLVALNGKINKTKIEFVVDRTLQQVMKASSLGELKVTRTSEEQPTHSSIKTPKPKKRSDSDPEDEPDRRSIRSKAEADTRSIRSKAGSRLDKRKDEKSDTKSDTKSVRFKEKDKPVATSEYISSFSGKTSSDNDTCWFTGIGCLPNGNIVLVDRHNSKIKLFGQDFKLVSELKLAYQPFGVAIVASTLIAVTIPRQNKIEIFSTDFELQHKSTIPTSERCYGISHAGSDYVLTCACASPPSLKVITGSGSEKHNISPEENFYQMFFRPWYVKYDKSGASYFISDCNKSELICVTASVIKRFTYKDISMNSPRGVYVCQDGNVLLAGFGSDNVQLISKEGSLVKDVLTRQDGIIGPQDLTLDRTETKLLMTFDPSSGDSNNVKIFTFKAAS